jgi:hypothetical protein
MHKAGTTWLHKTLVLHPDFKMPYQKELDYLCFNPDSRKKYSTRLASTLTTTWRDPAAARWYAEFLADWELLRYPRLFDHVGESFSADISPSYGYAARDEVLKAATVIPEAKVVIILRDPVERAWSHARHTIGLLNIDNETQRLVAYERFVKRNHKNRTLSQYPRIISDWQHGFGRRNVLVCFYDDLKHTPRVFIDDILSFAGASPFPEAPAKQLEARHNEGTEIPIPDELKRELRSRYTPMLQRLKRMVETNVIRRRNLPCWLESLQ